MKKLITLSITFFLSILMISACSGDRAKSVTAKPIAEYMSTDAVEKFVKQIKNLDENNGTNIGDCSPTKIRSEIFKAIKDFKAENCSEKDQSSCKVNINDLLAYIMKNINCSDSYTSEELDDSKPMDYNAAFKALLNDPEIGYLYIYAESIICCQNGQVLDKNQFYRMIKKYIEKMLNEVCGEKASCSFSAEKIAELREKLASAKDFKAEDVCKKSKGGQSAKDIEDGVRELLCENNDLSSCVKRAMDKYMLKNICKPLGFDSIEKCMISACEVEDVISELGKIFKNGDVVTAGVCSANKVSEKPANDDSREKIDYSNTWNGYNDTTIATPDKPKEDSSYPSSCNYSAQKFMDDNNKYISELNTNCYGIDIKKEFENSVKVYCGSQGKELSSCCFDAATKDSFSKSLEEATVKSKNDCGQKEEKGKEEDASFDDRFNKASESMQSQICGARAKFSEATQECIKNQYKQCKEAGEDCKKEEAIRKSLEVCMVTSEVCTCNNGLIDLAARIEEMAKKYEEAGYSIDPKWLAEFEKAFGIENGVCSKDLAKCCLTPDEFGRIDMKKAEEKIKDNSTAPGKKQSECKPANLSEDVKRSFEQLCDKAKEYAQSICRKALEEKGLTCENNKGKQEFNNCIAKNMDKVKNECSSEQSSIPATPLGNNANQFTGQKSTGLRIQSSGTNLLQLRR